MQWSDEAIVLSLRAHGETSAILEALTRSHGRHLGLVRGGASAKRRAVLQPGNRVKLDWRGRLSEHLGVFTAEPVTTRIGEMFERRTALTGLNAFAAIAGAVLPEREPHGPAFEGAELLLSVVAEHEFAEWGPVYVRWEMGLLDELGFGLDLSRCAATGARDNLVFVSPRSGRAVSAAAGEAYRDRLLALPAFLLGTQAAAPEPGAIRDGLALTGYFIASRVLAPHNKTVPEARVRLADLAARLAAESA